MELKWKMCRNPGKVYFVYTHNGKHAYNVMHYDISMSFYTIMCELLQHV